MQTNKTLLLPVPALLALALAGAMGFAVFLGESCTKPPDYSNIPEIEFIRLSKNLMRQSSLGPDTVIITFGFTDGDGDLGTGQEGPEVFVFDGRDNFEKPPYQLPKIDQQGVGNGISGEISILMPTTCCIFPPQNGIAYPPCDNSPNAPSMFDTVFYQIYIKDAAGNQSNTISTPPITLRCRF